MLRLDEPTNHVNDAARQMLAGALRQYPGIGLLVSHDRDLLDILCAQCLFLDPPRAVLRPGSWSGGAAQQAAAVQARPGPARNRLQGKDGPGPHTGKDVVDARRAGWLESSLDRAAVLVRFLVERLGRPEGGILSQRMLYLAQEIGLDEGAPMMDQLRALPGQELGRALAECSCALLLVSHDERFLGRLTHVRWEIAAGGELPAINGIPSADGDAVRRLQLVLRVHLS